MKLKNGLKLSSLTFRRTQRQSEGTYRINFRVVKLGEIAMVLFLFNLDGTSSGTRHL